MTQMCEILAACAAVAACPDIALAEISYNSPVYSESYAQKIVILLIMAHCVQMNKEQKNRKYSMTKMHGNVSSFPLKTSTVHPVS